MNQVGHDWIELMLNSAGKVGITSSIALIFQKYALNFPKITEEIKCFLVNIKDFSNLKQILYLVMLLGTWESSSHSVVLQLKLGELHHELLR